MGTSIFEKYQQTIRLKDKLKEFNDNLETHLITYPKQALEEAVKHGFPVDIANTYKCKQQINENNTYIILGAIQNCIVYLENVASDLHKAASRGTENSDFNSDGGCLHKTQKSTYSPKKSDI